MISKGFYVGSLVSAALFGCALGLVVAGVDRGSWMLVVAWAWTLWLFRWDRRRVARP